MKVILFDDHQIFAGSLEMAFKYSKDNDIEFAAHIVTMFHEIKEVIEVENPDIILLDIHLGESNGLIVGEELLKIYPDLKIVFLTGYDLAEYHNQALNIGGKGFLSKSISFEDLVKQLHFVANGGIIFPKMERKDYMELTTREKEILQMLADGNSQIEIADLLAISRRTVSNHLQSILDKLYVNSTLSAVVKAIELGIVFTKK